MSGRLDNAVSSVDADSLPATTDNNAPQNPASPDPGPVPGDQNGEGNGEGEGGRTVDNVRGELTRKLDQQQAYFTGQVSSLEAKIDRLLASPTVQAPAHSNDPQAQLDAMSLTDLRNLRSQVPEENLATFDQYYEDRRISEAVESKVQTITNQQSYQEQEQQANTEAMTRWPDLRDPTSTLYTQTNKILANLGSAADSDPRAVLNASNEAALQLGLAPRTVTAPRVQNVRHVAPGGSNAPAPGNEGSGSAPSKERLQQLSNSLANGFKGEISDEMMERIAQRTADYRDNKDKFVR